MRHSQLSPTIAEYFNRGVARHPHENALAEIRNGELHWLTWTEVYNRAAALAATQRVAGVEPGDRVAQVSENRVEWIITDLATHLAGAVHVPIHITLSAQQVADQIRNSGAKIVFVSTHSLLATFADHLPHNITVRIHDDSPIAYQPPAEPGPDIIFPAPSPQPPVPTALATLLYTSGTTGNPRGVMLSHANLATNAAALADLFAMNEQEVRLCVLPLSHIYARTCDLYTWLYRGTKLVLAESRETLARDLQLVRPTALNAVPYVFQKIAEKIHDAGGDETGHLRNFLGGRVELLNCGGAPLPAGTEAWFKAHGQTLLMGYGLTETSPVISASTPHSRRPGSVGRILPGVEIRIADDGELLTRGPNLMLGYWRDDAATAEAFRDGWFHTGDLAALDNDGYLFIQGRKKELIVLSTGKKVAPTHVESLLTSSPLIEQAAVFGDNHHGLVALIVPPPEVTPAGGLARPQDNTDQHGIYAAEIKHCLAAAAREEQIHAFAVLDGPFSIDRGELTAKLSLCRGVISQNFAAELTRLISQPLQVETAPEKSLGAAR
ncbi:MAG TPA: AMP-dependent synthetase/ligase [Lacipirellulaceae bacterium]|jgi:long-chain acyl-CoA synthetase|nr:AMP-dependent synthetase/ligase [Lacipirellulaceae bacterium]